MTLCDIYNMIENHCYEEIKSSVIENYIENYLNSDMKIIFQGYLEQAIYFNKILITKDELSNLIKNYVIQRKNNIKSFIKKGMFELKNLTKFLKDTVIKIKFLEDTIKDAEINLMEIMITQIDNIIFSDSIILLYIEEQLMTFNYDFKELLEFIKNNNIKIIKSFGDMYKKQIINMDELPLPLNIRRIQKLNNIIKYYNKINSFYKFMKDSITDINVPIFKLILENLIEIVKLNSLYEIEHTFNNILHFISNIKNNNFNVNESLITTLTSEIINKCSQPIKDINDINQIIRFGKYIKLLSQNIKLYNTYNNIFVIKIKKPILDYFKDEKKLIIFINENINNSIILNYMSDAKYCLTLINNIGNIDIFINIYTDFLKKRLMYYINISTLAEFMNNINNESNLINIIAVNNKNINCSILHKFNKLIDDTKYSYHNNIVFNKLSKKLLDVKMSVITTSYNIWDVSQTEGLININLIQHTQLGKYLKYYELYYIEKNQNKIINWFPHFGEMTITYINQKIKLLPIQFIILEMFNNVDELPINTIINSDILKSYSDKFKMDIINSIIISGLFIVNNDIIILSKSDSIKNDLIDIFMNTSKYPDIWAQEKQNELIYSRKEIINTVISHLLKIKPESKNDLFLLVSKNIKLFKLEEELYNESLKYLIDMDYIKLNDDKFEKLLF